MFERITQRMDNKSIAARYAVVFLLLMLTSGGVAVLQYEDISRTKGAPNIQQGEMPLEMGRWQGADVYLEERVYELLETRAIIHRSYTSPEGRAVFLSIVHYPEIKVDFHAPEACLGGRGIRVSKKETKVSLALAGSQKTIAVNQLIRKNGAAQHLIYYFYKTGDFMGSSYIRLRLQLIWERLRNPGRSASLVRISTPVAGDDMQEAARTLQRFMHQIYPYLVRNL